MGHQKYQTQTEDKIERQSCEMNGKNSLLLLHGKGEIESAVVAVAQSPFTSEAAAGGDLNSATTKSAGEPAAASKATTTTQAAGTEVDG